MKTTIVTAALAAVIGTGAFAGGDLASSRGAGFSYQSYSTTIRTPIYDTRTKQVLGYATRLTKQSPPPPRPASKNAGFKVGKFFFGTDGWLYYQIKKATADRVTGPDRAQLLNPPLVFGQTVDYGGGNTYTTNAQGDLVSTRNGTPRFLDDGTGRDVLLMDDATMAEFRRQFEAATGN